MFTFSELSKKISTQTTYTYVGLGKTWRDETSIYSAAAATALFKKWNGTIFSIEMMIDEKS